LLSSISKLPSSSRRNRVGLESNFPGRGLPGIVGGLIAESLVVMTEERRETIIVVCEIRGVAAGLSFKGSSDQVVPDPKADLFNAVGAVVREAIDDAADSLVKAFQ
jgi:hypothetical protein